MSHRNTKPKTRMESTSRKTALYAITIATIITLLSGCVKKIEPIPNPGFDEIDLYINNTNNLTNQLEQNITENNESITVSPEQKKGLLGTTKNVFNYIIKLFDTVVKGLFGEKGWYYIAASIIILVVFALFKKIGLAIGLLILIFLIKTVVEK